MSGLGVDQCALDGLADVKGKGRSRKFLEIPADPFSRSGWVTIWKALPGKSEDEYYQTVLHMVAAGGHKKLVELLATHKANLNARTENGRTPLHKAICANHGEMAWRHLVQGLCSQGYNQKLTGRQKVWLVRSCEPLLSGCLCFEKA